MDLKNLLLKSFNNSIVKDKNEQVTPEEAARKVFRTLYSEGVCLRCCLRFMNCHEGRVFQQTEEVLRSLFVDLAGTDLKQDENQRCIACLDISRLITSEAFKKQLFEIAKQSEFEFKNFMDFTFSITVPPSIVIRNYSLWYFLNEKFPNLLLPNIKLVDVKDIVKWIVSRIIYLESRVDYNATSNLNVTLTFAHKDSDNESEFVKKLDKSKKRKLLSNMQEGDSISLNNVQKILNYSTKEAFLKYGICPPSKDIKESSSCNITITHLPIFIAGRYNKYSRTMSQTRWIIDGIRKADVSVEERIGDFLQPYFKCDSYKFHAAGREDADVRMMGKGRPFVIELVNPHKIKQSKTIPEFETQANSLWTDLHLRDLQVVTRGSCSKLKEGEEDKSKTYRAIVWISKDISEKDLEFIKDIKDLAVDQKTPIRVLHRRTLMQRKKMIYNMSFQVINKHMIALDLTTQAGTYIKEFVHGDLERTTPNFSTIVGCPCDILQLDVLNIHIDFPPSTSK